MLAKTPLAEASALLFLLTNEFGLVKARAQGVRKPGAKLAGATQTLVESDIILVRGKEGWRLSGAVIADNWFGSLSKDNRSRAGRVARFMLRMVHGESTDTTLYAIMRSFLEALTQLEDTADAAEHLVVLRILHELGFDAGEGLGQEGTYDPELLALIEKHKREYVIRINRGIAASGL